MVLCFCCFGCPLAGRKQHYQLFRQNASPSTATLVFIFLFFSRFYQTLFFQREKRCDNRYSTNGGASTWRQRTWSRGNASTQCHSSGNYWTSGLLLYCGCSSPGEFDVPKTGAEVMKRFKCRGSGSLKLFVQPFWGIIGCRTRVAFVNCYRSVSMKLWWEVVLCSVSVLFRWICCLLASSRR